MQKRIFSLTVLADHACVYFLVYIFFFLVLNLFLFAGHFDMASGGTKNHTRAGLFMFKNYLIKEDFPPEAPILIVSDSDWHITCEPATAARLRLICDIKNVSHLCHFLKFCLNSFYFRKIYTYLGESSKCSF